MKKKFLLLFSLIILCVPLITAQQTNHKIIFTSSTPCKDLEFISDQKVTAQISPFSIVFDNGQTLNFVDGKTFDKSLISNSFKFNWNPTINIVKKGFSGSVCYKVTGSYNDISITPELSNVTTTFSKSANVILVGVDAAGHEKTIKDCGTIYSGSTISLSAAEIADMKKYGALRIKVDLFDKFTPAETRLPVNLVSTVQTYNNAGNDYVVDYYSLDGFVPEPSVANSRTETLTLLGEPDTRISGLQESGGHTSDHALNITQSGTGVVILTQCNLTSLMLSLLNVDFTCQTITSLVQQDASGNVKRTFTPADYSTIGTNQIQLSLSNVVGLADNDKLQIALTNSCTTNHESDYTIVLSTEGKNQDATAYINKDLFPDGSTKVPIAISQKAGTAWCDNSSAYFFNVSGTNGYTNINFANATADGSGAFSVAKGQSAITGTANYYKCLTGVNIAVPTTKMPKTPAISNVEYCNGTNFALAINNPSDYSTETFRLLLDGSEKVGWQGTKNFAGINLAKVGSASAVVEANNGECIIASNTATVSSRIQPIALVFNGSLSYYTEQVNTTIVQTTSQTGVTYNIYKDGSATPQDTWIGIKAQTLTKGSYKITATNANASCSAETNLVIVEKDLNIGSAWVTTDLSFCQLEGTKDLNSFVSFNGTSSVVFTSTTGLALSGSNIDLAASTPATYTITCTAIKDGVTKVFTKDFTVKQKANDIAISLLNPTDFSCNTDNPQLQVTTDYPGYSYTWSKGSTVQSGNLRTNTIALTKAEGSQNFTAVATATNGCLSSPSNTLTLVKNNLTADINFTSGIKTFCQSIAGTANVFDDLTGTDRVAISLEQSGWTYNVTTSSSDMILINRNQIDLERTKAGTYTVTMAYSQNGCTKTITKQYNIKQMPSAVTVTLDNASTIECDLTNPNAQVHGSNSNYTYNWTKNSTAVSGNTQAMSIPVSKADGLTTISAVPVLDGCLGLKSNEVSLTKRYVVADVAFSTGVTEYCQKTGGSIDIFTELSGTDKIAVVNSQSGFTWALTPSGSGLKITGSSINLETSQAGTYTVTLTISKDGCSKSITKDVMIRMRPADFTISQTNSTDFACNTSAAALAASVTSYTYNWYKGGANAGSGTTINIPTTKADVSNASRTVYAIGTAANGCETNPSANLILPLKTFLEADISISSGTATFCQSPVAAKTDVFDFLAGTDKLAVTTNQHYTWTITAPGLTLASTHEIDLFNSPAGTYIVSFNYVNDGGCAKTLTKTVVINPRPNSVTVTLTNASTIECDLSNPNALVQADNSGYTYNWTKNGTLLSGNTQSMSIPVSKSDGLTSISAVPFLGTCIGLPSNTVTLTKRYVQADVTFSTGVTQYCQITGGSVDLFTELSGTDKIAVVNSQSGFSWSLSPSGTGLVMTGSSINLETSQAGTYTVTMTISKDGCSKVITKDVLIRVRPADFTISQTNPIDFACNTSAAALAASVTSYTYNWYKGGANAGSGTTINIPTTKADVSNASRTVYAIGTAANGCQTNPSANLILPLKTFLEADISISSGTATFCQSPVAAKTDVFDFLSGTDKLAVTTKQHYTWTITAPGLTLASTHEIDLFNSPAGTYTVSFNYLNDGGCAKTLTKTVVINPRPNSVAVTLTNASTIECDLSNPNALVQADNSGYTYNWTKNGVAVTGNTQAMSIPVSKSDGLTSISAVPFLGTCIGLPSNTVTLTKRYVEADLAFSGAGEYCQTVGTTLDMKTLLSGSDKDKVLNEQAGYTWDLGYSSTGLLYLDSRNSIINLEKSFATTYTSSLNIHRDGCLKTLIKDIKIKPRPISVDISLQNSDNLTCNTADAQFKAAVSIYTYNWYKNSTQLTETSQNLTLPIAKADGLVSVYAIPVLDGCIGVQTNSISAQKHFVEADLAFSTGVASYCQYPKTTVDLFTELSGTDKLAIQGKQSGWGWSFTGSTPDLVIVGSSIDLEKSASGTYTVSMIITKDGCSKTITKSVVVKAQPSNVTVTLTNASTIECDLSNPNALVQADNSAYTYNWTKNGVALADNTQSMSIPVSKADGLTTISAVPVLNGCNGLKSNEVSLTKRYVVADVAFNATDITYCQKDNGTVDLFAAHLIGADKDAVQSKKNGFDWSFVAPSALVINNGVIDLQKSASGVYDLSLVISNNGCSKTLTKSVVIKEQPGDITIALTNNTDYSCNPDAAQLQASVTSNTYSWYKNGTLISGTGSNTAQITIPVSKADGTTNFYAVGQADNSCASRTSNVISVVKHFVEADLTFSTGVASYCQYPATKVDLFTELSGTDKLAIQGKQNGWGWTFSGSTSDLVISGSSIDLEKSASGAYTVSMVITKDGCSKTITKAVVVKDMPSNVAVTLDNAATIECDLSNPNAQVHADNSAYSYNWTKNGTQITGTTQAMSIPVSKADGLTTISAVPVLNGCVGLQTNSVSLTKRFVEADFGFNNTAITLASKDEAVNLFDYTVGKDKDAIINQTGGFSYKIAFSPVKQTAIGSTDGTVVPASGLQSGDTQYTLNVIVSKNGCDLTYSKTAIIKSIPRNVTIDFATAQSSQECTSNNYMNVVASDSTSGFVYSWYKNDVLVAGQTTYKAKIEVFKTDGTVKIYAIPATKDGFAGYKTNILNTTKRYVTADLQLDQTTQTLCAVAGSKINVFDYVRGNDKAAVLAGQYGYTYNTAGDCGTAIATNQFVDVDNSLADDNATKTVSLTVSQNGCSVTQNKTFVIKRRPSDITIELLSKASNTTNNNLFCGGDTLSLHVSSSNTADVSYNWFKDGALIGNTTTPSFVYPFTDASGTINLSATSVYNSNSCPSTVSNVITVQKKDVNFNINMANDAVAYCPEIKKINLFDYVSGDDKNNVMTQSNNCSYEFTASGNNGLAIVSYSFLDLDNSTSATNPYTLTFNVNKQGCTKQFTKNISIKPRPVTPLIALTSNKELRYCGGDGVSFTDQNAVTGTTYKWNVNGTTIDGTSTSTLKYSTDAGSDLVVQATAYLTSNSCPSKQSNILSVSNVLPKVELKLISQKVTVNDNIQLYIYEPIPSKSITLKAVRVSDKTVSDLPYTRNGNVLTLAGILPIGEYEISGIAENSLSGYCSQNIIVPYTLTVTAAQEKQNVSEETKANELAIKNLFNETMAKLKAGEVHAILLPIMTTSAESAKLTVYTNETNESVIIHVLDINGKIISSKTEFLNQGENDFSIEPKDKPSVPSMYLIQIQYSKANKTETLKGLIK